MLMEQFSSFGMGGPRPNKISKQELKVKLNLMPSLYVSNLPKENFYDLEFFRLFANRGYKVKSGKVVIDSKTNKSRGYGYLQFVDKDEAQRCLDAMNNENL